MKQGGGSGNLGVFPGEHKHGVSLFVMKILERLRKLRYRDPLKTPPGVQGGAEKRREAYQLAIFALAESTEAKHEAKSQS